MAHIGLPADLPGILGPMAFRPETAQSLNALADTLLHQAHTLPAGERELIATFVSSLNDCHFCQHSHAAVAAAHLGSLDLANWVRRDYKSAPISDKLKGLLAIAERVQKGGKHVTFEVVQAARDAGASDLEIHDAVLIAAAFCMFNRYVDGLGTWAPRQLEAYAPMGRQLAQNGYKASAPKGGAR